MSFRSLWMPTVLLLMGFCTASTSQANEGDLRIRMPFTPSLSPDGSQIAFSWIGEIWTADKDGSNIRRLTNHSAVDGSPLFSPDGSQIAFTSSRTGSNQIFIMDVDGGGLRQVTFHSSGYTLADWYPDGQHLLALGNRDHYHRDATRMMKVSINERRADEVLADVMAEDAKLSPAGDRILFSREGERWWRKGYEGERSAQIWMLDLDSGEVTELLHEGVECMWPQWASDGKGFYFTKGAPHGFDLWHYRFGKGNKKPKQKKVQGFDDDSIVYPSISRDGSTIVFRHLFDLYSMQTDTPNSVNRIDLQLDDDVQIPGDEMRREFTSAGEVAFSRDGLEVALIAGGDLWVMDTKLREPKQITTTAGAESDVIFSTDGKALWFTSVTDGQVDVWKATRADDEKYWWQNEEFLLEQITEDPHVESDLRLVDEDSKLLFQQGRGNLTVLDLESKARTSLIEGFSGIDYDVSTDGQWITYSKQDNDFNSDIWIARLDGSIDPVNVSRHPDNESNPRFSPDGKILAFTGRRIDREVDIHYVYLQLAEEQETARDRLLEEAIDLMKKKRKDSANGPGAGKKDSKDSGEGDGKKDAGGKEGDSKDGEQEDATEEEDEGFEFDLERIHERVKRVSISDSFERGLLFSPDSKKLLFSASVDGKSGWYTIEFPDKLRPTFLSASTGSGPVWTKESGAILYSRGGVPARLEPSGKQESYSFDVAQKASRSAWLKAGFEQAWLVMREAWYDPSYNNNNWDEIRRKYAPIAAEMHDTRGLGEVVQLMLGELNGSHLGFYPNGGSRATVDGDWQDTTAHLGVRFDPEHNGPGLLVNSVLTDGPADRVGSRLHVGDVIMAIDGTAVDPALDLTTVLNGRMDREIHLNVQRESEDGKKGDHEIHLRPISYSRARSLLYGMWLERNRQQVDEASEGKLGYLHIRAMDMGSFYEFERQLYNVGYGREGLVIDVRDNGGGSTTDLLLTALTQPRHAITVPRGGGQGYPQDRAVFATWSKPIIVLCNQNSYSNAEIFSHAIKNLGRGKVVGVQTAGGVVSTGSATVGDVGRIRVPFRGWFLITDGEDMERNGCLPNVTVWPKPGELPAGVDRQLETAVEMLVEEVGEGSKDKKLRYASERDR